MPDALVHEFVDVSRRTLLGEYWPRLRECVESLTDEQVWWRPHEQANSIGNLLLHLNGNVTQWLLVTFAEVADRRNRPAEFRQRTAIPRAELLGALEQTLAGVDKVLGMLTAEQLAAKHSIQGSSVSGLEAVYHVVEHFGMHYGQIVYITKLWRGVDLGFYAHLNPDRVE